MPTGPDEEPTVEDGPGASDVPDAPPDGFESFLSAVRGMVHGDEGVAAPVPDDGQEGGASPQEPPLEHSVDDATIAPSPSEWVAEDEPSDWLPGTWVVDAPTAPRRRADRRMEKSLARQEKKLRDAERRNVRGARKRGPTPAEEASTPVDDDAPAGRVPAQPGPEPGGRAEAQGRRRRRQRRQDEARAMAVSDETNPELVPSGQATAAGSAGGATDSRTRKRRRRDAGAGGGAAGESRETPALLGAMSETASMSTLGADPVQERAGDDEPSPDGADALLSRAARRAERREAKRARRAEARAEAVQQQLAAEAARRARDEQARLARMEKHERRIDAKVARKAAAAAKRERRAEEAAARTREEPVLEESVVEEIVVGAPDADEPATDVVAPRTRAEKQAERAAEKAAAKAERAAVRAEQQAARRAAQAEERRRRAEERETREVAEAEERRRRAEEKVARELAEADERRRRAEEEVARAAAAAEERQRRAEEKAARAAEERRRREEERAAREAADAEERRRREEERAAREAADAEERRRREEERAAQAAAEAEAAEAERERRAAEKHARAAAAAAARAAEERHRLEARLARLEAKATARADKDAQRLAGHTARADARAMAEAEALDRRQDRRARRIEKRRTRADARSAREIARLERRRERRNRRVEKKSARTRARAREESERLEERRGEIARLTDAVPLGVGSGRVPAEDESLAHYLGRVEASILPWRSRRSRSRFPVRVRRAARIGAACVLIGGAAVLPWAAPQVAGVIADALPGGDGHVAAIKDPPVGPRTNAVAGPVGIATETNPLAGKRLAAAGWPRRVQVPRLHVDSTVVPISGQSGSLLPPDDPQILGWWREGRPVGAEFGSAVITGHTVHTGGGALDNLDKLAVGDTIRVQTDDGWITYVVHRARIYSTQALARDASDIFRLSGDGRLVMITCDNWNGSFYESNAVVFAAPTSDDPFEGEGVGHVPDPGPGGTS